MRSAKGVHVGVGNRYSQGHYKGLRVVSPDGRCPHLDRSLDPAPIRAEQMQADDTPHLVEVE